VGKGGKKTLSLLQGIECELGCASASKETNISTTVRNTGMFRGNYSLLLQLPLFTHLVKSSCLPLPWYGNAGVSLHPAPMNFEYHLLELSQSWGGFLDSREVCLPTAALCIYDEVIRRLKRHRLPDVSKETRKV